MYDTINDFKKWIRILTFIATPIVILAIVYTAYAFYLIRKGVFNTLAVLFSLSFEELNNLSEKAKKFLRFIKSEAEVGDRKALDEDVNQDANRDASTQNRLSKKAKDSGKKYSMGYLGIALAVVKFHVAFLVFEAFYVLYHVNGTSCMEKFINFKTELSKTGQICMYYMYSGYLLLCFLRNAVGTVTFGMMARLEATYDKNSSPILSPVLTTLSTITFFLERRQAASLIAFTTRSLG